MGRKDIHCKFFYISYLTEKRQDVIVKHYVHCATKCDKVTYQYKWHGGGNTAINLDVNLKGFLSKECVL